MTNKPEPVRSKILRPDSVPQNAIVLECDGFKIDIDVYADRVALFYEDSENDRAKIQFSKQDSSTVAALLRAAADDLEKL